MVPCLRDETVAYLPYEHRQTCQGVVVLGMPGEPSQHCCTPIMRFLWDKMSHGMRLGIYVDARFHQLLELGTYKHLIHIYPPSPSAFTSSLELFASKSTVACGKRRRRPPPRPCSCGGLSESTRIYGADLLGCRAISLSLCRGTYTISV